jgi:hypothetical protein
MSVSQEQMYIFSKIYNTNIIGTRASSVRLLEVTGRAMITTPSRPPVSGSFTSYELDPLSYVKNTSHHSSNPTSLIQDQRYTSYPYLFMLLGLSNQ